MKYLLPLLVFVLISPQGVCEDSVEQSAQKCEEQITTISAVGDIQLGREVWSMMSEARDYDWPMEHVADRLAAADITVGNLEAQFFTKCPILEEGMRLCAGPEAVQSLVSAGFDLVSVENNHAENFGPAALRASIKTLKDNNISAAAENRKARIVERSGIKFAFLAYSPVHKVVPLQKIAAQIKRAKRLADVVIVMPHWGIEYDTSPSPKQRRLADFMVSKGADLIIGAHPHVLQPVEKIRDVDVLFSLGNFVFDMMDWSDETRTGAVAQITFCGTKLQSIEMVKVELRDVGFPRFLDETP